MPLHSLTSLHTRSPVSVREIERGLCQPVKTLPTKLLYDARGSELFERITRLPEYYLTRVEQAIMDRSADEICAGIGPGALLVELGSGSSQKTRTLLDRLDRPAGYVPVDISAERLTASAQEIAARYPDLDVMPVCADYELDFTVPEPPAPPARTVVYFPGSTIGNFHPDDAVDFLLRIKAICGDAADILIGVDLKKDPGLLHRAYNDCEGVTAEFNLNLLTHINRVFGLDFDPGRFEHLAAYNERMGRIEMYLRSLNDQAVHVAGTRIEIGEGECIWTESSYKYTLDEFGDLTARAGCRARQVWTDDNRLFGVLYLETV